MQTMMMPEGAKKIAQDEGEAGTSDERAMGPPVSSALLQFPPVLPTQSAVVQPVAMEPPGETFCCNSPPALPTMSAARRI